MPSTNHLLVIRLSAMGDVAMTVPVLRALTTQYPKVQVTLLTRRFFEPMFSSIPNVQIFEADVKGKHKGIVGLWKLFKELKANQIDAVADLHDVLRSNILKIFFRFAGISVVQIDKGRQEKRALTAGQNKVFAPLKSGHQRYADVFERLGFPINLTETILLGQQALSDSTKWLVNTDSKIWIGLAPFAAFEGKMYPLEMMREVVEYLNQTNNYQIFLFGGGNQEEMQLAKWEEAFPNCTNLAGKLTFAEELSVISHLKAMVAMDSSNGHLAANYGILVITIWGVTHPYAGFSPFGQTNENSLLADRKKFPLIPTSVYGHKVPNGYEKAIRTISPRQIFEKVEYLLKD